MGRKVALIRWPFSCSGSPSPVSVKLSKAEIPIAADLHFIRTKDKILLVRSPNMVVTGEIAAE